MLQLSAVWPGAVFSDPYSSGSIIRSGKSGKDPIDKAARSIIFKAWDAKPCSIPRRRGGAGRIGRCRARMPPSKHLPCAPRIATANRTNRRLLSSDGTSSASFRGGKAGMCLASTSLSAMTIAKDCAWRLRGASRYGACLPRSGRPSVGGRRKNSFKILGHTRNVIDNEGPKMRRMRQMRLTRNVYENK